MKTLLHTFAAVLFAASSALAAAPKGTYVGTSKTTVKYLNPDTLETVATEAYSCNETVIIGALKKASGVVESNPFSLTILATKPKTPPAFGDVKLASARIFPIPGGGSGLVQYWLLQNTTAGFSGLLFDNHRVDGLALDRVVAKLGSLQGPPAGFKMHDGQIGAALQCKISATVTGRQMVVTLIGYAFVPNQAIIQFTTKINARR